MKRREFLHQSVAISAAVGALSSTVAGAARSVSSQSVEDAFGGLVDALKTGNLERFYGYMHERFIMIDEDIPFRLDKAEFRDHISFHTSGIWESFGWIPGRFQVNTVGESGHIAGAALFRGKPRDAGFRVRHLLFSQTWTRDSQDNWRLLLWHQSPLDGHMLGTSPS